MTGQQRSTDPMIGATLAGRYQIDACIGFGAMGAVYSAVQVGLGRRVALKVLKRDISSGPDAVARFRREAHATSALMHPNTVRVFDFGATADGLLYLAMELLEGELATTRLLYGGVVDVAEAVSIAQQVLRSVSEAHAKKIIHRDLKPDNIFLARVEGQTSTTVKVLDFGIAKAVEGDRTLNQFETQDGTVFGTPRYMSPEQAQGKSLDARSDLYAVGIILYELLTGSAPFVDDDAVIVMAKHIREAVPAVRIAAPDRRIPASVEAVVTRALAKNPNDRFETADEFDQALEACRADIDHAMAGGSLRISFADRLRHVPQEKKRTASMIGASLAAGTVFAALGFALLRSPEAANVEASAIHDDPDANPIDDPMVMVESDPIHATVWFDGQVLGVTPIAVVLPQGKPMRVELRKEGFAMTPVDVTANHTTQRVAMEPLPDGPVDHQAPAMPEPNHSPIGVRTTHANKHPRAPREKKIGHAPYERFE